ncbi:hypothetical protein ACHAQH_002148 [Verticillium albo-atrum]
MSFVNKKDLALPPGSKILVTGTSGYIASNVVVEAINAGYNIRGTARSAAKAEKTKHFDSPNYEVVVVPEMDPEGAFDEAVKGVDAIIHMASPLTFSPNPKEVVPPAVKGATSILRSASRESGIKRFVFTSSSTSTSLSTPGKKFKINSKSWNTEVDDFADFPPPYPDEDAFKVYAASKTKAEAAVWDFMREEHPHFTVNFSERILAFNVPFNWNTILEAFRGLFPDRSFPENRELGSDLSEVDNALGAELLEKWYGLKGYTSLEESLKQNVEGIL